MNRPALFVAIAFSAACVAALAASTVERYSKRNGSLEITRADGAAAFKLQSQVGQNSCEIEGQAVFVDANRAAYTSNDSGDMCVVVLRFSASQVSVTTKDCNRYCGLNAGGSMDGVFKTAR